MSGVWLSDKEIFSAALKGLNSTSKAETLVFRANATLVFLVKLHLIPNLTYYFSAKSRSILVLQRLIKSSYQDAG